MYTTNISKTPNYLENHCLVINKPLFRKNMWFLYRWQHFFFVWIYYTYSYGWAIAAVTTRDMARTRSHLFTDLCSGCWQDVWVCRRWLIVSRHWVISTKKKHIIIILHESSNNRPGFDRLMFFRVEPVAILDIIYLD